MAVARPPRAARTAPDPAVARWIRRELAAESQRAPSLIVTVWGDALFPHGDETWLATLIALLAPFGFNHRAVRTGVFRLARDGWLAARPVGRRSRYRLTAEGEARFAGAFHRVYDAPFERWDGTWEGLLVHSEGIGPAARRHLREELGWAGFAPFAPGVFLRPARRDAASARIAESLGLERFVSGFLAREAPESSLATLASRAETVFALSALSGDYRRFLARFSGVAAAFAQRADPDPAQAFVVRTLLVHAYRRVRLRDPQLPRAALPPGLARCGRIRALPGPLPDDTGASAVSPRRGVRRRGRIAAERAPCVSPALHRERLGPDSSYGTSRLCPALRRRRPIHTQGTSPNREGDMAYVRKSRSMLHPAAWRRRQSGYRFIDRQYGRWGYILAWLIGIPIPILLLVYLLRGCN